MFFNIHTHIIANAERSIFNVIVGQDVVPQNNWYSIGIHPWYIYDEKTMLHTLESELIAENTNCLFIGECGLDKLKGAEASTQLKAFKSQVVLSERFNKPLLIHCVKRFSEIQHLKKEIQPVQPWIIHGFNKNKELANQLIKQGFYLSIGAQLLSSNKIQEVLLNTPLNFIFFETDAQSEITIVEIYTFASQLLKIELDVLKNIIKDNLWTITGWKEQNS